MSEGSGSAKGIGWKIAGLALAVVHGRSQAASAAKKR